MNKKILSNIALFLTALIWGLSFVAQKAGMDYVGPFSFNFIRSILGGLSLLPVISIAKIIQKDTRTKEIKHEQHINLAKAGLSCGAALFTAMSIQQYCMLGASAGKAGFISSLYIIYVPLISMSCGRKLTKIVKSSVGIALLVLYLLCFKPDSGGFSFYDLMLLIGAFFYGVHILVVNHFSGKVNATKISCVQFFVVGILSLPLMLIFEEPTLNNFMAGYVPILYAGVLTCGVAYTLQIFGQKYTQPTVASLILCLESVFAVLGGCTILHESMTLKEIIGCVFMISAVILSQTKGHPKLPPQQTQDLEEKETLNTTMQNQNTETVYK